MTIKEVAKEAGVSIATISRVINGTGQIKPSTRQSVLEAIRRLGYEALPREERRGPKKKQARKVQQQKIGFLVPDVHEGAMHTVLTGRLMTGISQELQPLGVDMVFTKLTSEDAIPANINSEMVNGLIVKNWVSYDGLREALDEIPHVVCLETEFPEKVADQIMPDTEQLAYEAVNFFLDRGVKEIFVIADIHINTYPQAIRGKKFAEKAANAGCQVVELGLEPGNLVPNLSEKLLVPSTEKRGIFISSGDPMTTQIYLIIQRAGLTIGKDFEFVTIADKPDLPEYLDPKITIIDLKPEEMGQVAAETMLWRMKNPTASQRKIQIAPKLIPGAE